MDVDIIPFPFPDGNVSCAFAFLSYHWGCLIWIRSLLSDHCHLHTLSTQSKLVQFFHLFGKVTKWAPTFLSKCIILSATESFYFKLTFFFFFFSETVVKILANWKQTFPASEAKTPHCTILCKNTKVRI